MNPVLLAQLISSLGTVGLPLVQQIMEDIKAGRTQTTVAPEDIAEVIRLSKQTAADIFARMGVTPPPAASDSTPAAPSATPTATK